jgi:hypothetical protein
MAHELEIRDGQASMFYVGGEPWHGLGTPLAHPATAAEAIKAARLDWTVKKLPLYAVEKGDSLLLPDSFAVVRNDLWGKEGCPVLGVGRVAQYMGLAQVPWLLAKGTTGSVFRVPIGQILPARHAARRTAHRYPLVHLRLHRHEHANRALDCPQVGHARIAHRRRENSLGYTHRSSVSGMPRMNCDPKAFAGVAKPGGAS